MLTYKTRHSKNPDKLNRKNTLVTIRDGDTIFFGISRCNVSAGDKFSKAKGQMVAKARAEKARQEFGAIGAVVNAARASQQADGFVAGSGHLSTHFSGLRGFIRADSVPELLQYFRNIDKIAQNPRFED